MAYKLSWIGKDIHRLIIDEETIDVLTSRVHEKCPQYWKWKGPHILAFEHFKYYGNGYNFDTSETLVNRMRPARTMMSPNLPEIAQQEVEVLLKLAENAGPSPCLNKLKGLKRLQHVQAKGIWIDAVAGLLDPTF